MDTKEHIDYLKDFKKYSKEVTRTKETSKEFLIRAGILTPTGRLSRSYTSTVSPKTN
jgi:hypothetical protein